MPLDEIAGEVAESILEAGYEFVAEQLYKGIFRRLFHATGRFIIQTVSLQRAQIEPNKRRNPIGKPLRPTKGDSFAVFVGFVFWASVTGSLIYWYWFT